MLASAWVGQLGAASAGGRLAFGTGSGTGSKAAWLGAFWRACECSLARGLQHWQLGS